MKVWENLACITFATTADTLNVVNSPAFIKYRLKQNQGIFFLKNEM